MDTRPDEQERGITIKSTAISMFFEMAQEDMVDVKQKYEGTEILHMHTCHVNNFFRFSFN